jgi:hypothetical protein
MSCVTLPFLPEPVSYGDSCSHSLLREIPLNLTDGMFPPGKYQYAFSVVDIGSNAARCQFNLTVLDSTTPTISE